jgi:hypothetical protein
MGRTATALQYRPITVHGGTIQLWKVTPSGANKYGIAYPDGRFEKRKDGSGMAAFNEKVIARDTERFGSVCRYCGDFALKLTVDHVIAWSLVGDYTNAANVAACCKGCNEKYNKYPKPDGLVSRILRENGEMGRGR